MKILSHDPGLCIACHTCEEVCSETFFKEINAEKSRIRIYDEEEGLPSAVFCNQCGACIDACPTLALYRNRRGNVRIKMALCVGCLSCVGFCPYGAMFYHNDNHEPFNCLACAMCVDECPEGALAIKEIEEAPSPPAK